MLGKGAGLEETSLLSPLLCTRSITCHLRRRAAFQIWGNIIIAEISGEKLNTLGMVAAGLLHGLKCWEVSERGVSAKIKKFPEAKYLRVLKCFLCFQKYACPTVSHVGWNAGFSTDGIISYLAPEGKRHFRHGQEGGSQPWSQGLYKPQWFCLGSLLTLCSSELCFKNLWLFCSLPWLFCSAIISISACNAVSLSLRSHQNKVNHQERLSDKLLLHGSSPFIIFLLLTTIWRSFKDRHNSHLHS